MTRSPSMPEDQNGPVRGIGCGDCSAGILAGDIFRNKYGLLLRVVRVEKRGVVRVLGSHGSWDIHEGITEWRELRKDWKSSSPNGKMRDTAENGPRKHSG
jgi:hypothetical protein